MMDKDCDIAWAAGFYEGEGWAGIYQQTRKSGHIYKYMKHLLLTALIFFSIPNFSEESDKELVNIGEIWTLSSRSGNTMSVGGEVLYLMPNSAYETYRSRKFGDWNQFSIIDTRNLVKLRRGYQIEILEGLYQNNIFKVKLLSGNSKGRKYYVITEDLLKKYTVEEQEV